MHTDIKPPKIINIIADREKGKSIVEFLNGSGFHLHTAFLGKGTAPSDILSIFSLGEKEKVIILLAAAQERIEGLFNNLKEKFKIGSGSGIAFSVSVNSISNMEVVKFLKCLNDKEISING